ncbi:hypothetical protein MKY95_10000 [Paenibacillus sp. FSL P4-0176]|uniref:hypothetical protein n=1 Tax=Paenibacillus sp. FSL P4-0176 TaxID=2921631 RepID=UPI0030D35C13
MTLANIKPSTISLSKGIFTVATNNNVTWTIEEVITDCDICKKALGLIAYLKAVLATEDLCYEFMMRVPFDPNGQQVSDLLDKMREEQLQINPMSHESFLDMYLFNPLQALMQYFKHSVSTSHLERIKQWGIDIKDVIKLKHLDNTIHLNDALEKLYLK